MPTLSSPARARRTAALAATLVASLGLAAPAVAQGYSVSDPVGDTAVSSDSFDQSGGTTTIISKDPAIDPSNRNGDINAMSARHDRGRVVVNIGMVEFNAPPSSANDTSTTEGMAGVGVQIQTRSPRRTYGVIGLFDGTHGDWALLRATRHGAKQVRCRGFSHVVGADHTVSMSIPRRCLSNPRSLRVSAGSFVGSQTESATSMSDISWQDDAQQTGLGNDPEATVYGPWLRRG